MSEKSTSDLVTVRFERAALLNLIEELRRLGEEDARVSRARCLAWAQTLNEAIRDYDGMVPGGK